MTTRPPGRSAGEPVRVETLGSYWLIDEEQSRYCRMPKTEQPRPPEWSRGDLKDLVWHPFESWAILTEKAYFRTHEGQLVVADVGYLPALRIVVEDGRIVAAPRARVL